MKNKLLFSLFLFLFLTGFKSTEKQTYYFFCTSRPMHIYSQTQKVDFLYTKIKEIKADKTDIWELTKKWAALKNSKCSSGNCTADFNYYESYESAKKVFDKVIENENNYYLIEIKFE